MPWPGALAICKYALSLPELPCSPPCPTYSDGTGALMVLSEKPGMGLADMRIIREEGLTGRA